GYVYVLSNPKMPGLFTVGCTTRSVEERVEELNQATGVPVAFQIEARFPTSAPKEHELAIHKRLAAHRIQGREFFETGMAEILQTIEFVTGVRSTVNPIPSSETDLRRWHCALCKSEWTGPSHPAPQRCEYCKDPNAVVF
ncbi:MAG TPA: GIY-YIG nuclease family protein, partial [Bryobacteraceae bacterium]|nr:GIY-YIG nuclease family protein [Bryobacteraceae bacterium]